MVALSLAARPLGHDLGTSSIAMGRPLRSYEDELIALARRSDALNHSGLEDLDRDEISNRLIPAVELLLEDAIELLSKMLDEGGDEVVGADSLVLDLIHVGRAELRRRLERLRSAAREPRCQTALEVCDGCMRAVRKCAAATERALAQQGGHSPVLHDLSQVQVARRIRTHYARLRREVATTGPPEEARLVESLRKCGTSMAHLMGQDIFSAMRIGDRSRFRSLQERLVAWLGGADGHDSDSGLRLWQDIHSFTILLRGINLRSEIQEHDKELVATSLAELRTSLDSEQPPAPQLLRQLSHLSGRDDEIDALLSRPQGGSAEVWARILQRLKREMSSSEPPSKLLDEESPSSEPRAFQAGTSHPSS